MAFLPGTIMSFPKLNQVNFDEVFDVIIVGGSYSGLSAAMALGRSLRKVLIIDNSLPCNRYSSQSHNFITRDGEPPNEIANRAKTQVLKYDTVQFHTDKVIEVQQKSIYLRLEQKMGTCFYLLIVDGNQKTNIPGIYACGDNSAFRSVAVAVSTGNQAGAAINSALCIEQFNL